MKITIVGTGYVGLVSGACFAKVGHEVLCIDIDKAKIENLKKGIIPIYEPDLEALVQRNQKEKKLKFSTDIKKGIEFADIVFCCVAAKFKRGTGTDLKNVIDTAKAFAKYTDRYKVFVNKSTIPVGTTNDCEKIINKEIKEGIEFDIVSNPEFLREGSCVFDFLNPDRIVIGAKSEKVFQIMEKLYDPIKKNEACILKTSIASAELAKYASNAFLATKISFINEMSGFCELTGANINEVAQAMGLDKRIGKDFLNAGIGFGGSCLPKDLRAIIKNAKDKNYKLRILDAVYQVNRELPKALIKKLKQELRIIKGKQIAILGLAFKPDTDDMREAPSISIIESLKKEGVQINVYDPKANSNANKIFGSKNINYCHSQYDAIKNCEAALILTEWKEFKEIDFKKVIKLMKNPFILDGRNIFKKEIFKNSPIKYIGIGQ